MTSRRCVNADGSPKVRFPTGSEARQRARAIRRRGGTGKGMNAYRCDECGWWHIGHLTVAQSLGEVPRPKKSAGRG